MSNWKRNKELAITRDETPTLTDQSQAKDSDINIIVRLMGHTGTVPGAHGQPMGGDFTGLPTDLRGFIEKAREINTLQRALPPQLNGKTLDELVRLTTDELKQILAPATTPPTQETPK